MSRTLDKPLTLSWLLVGCMAVQSVLGRIMPGQYRDVEWIRVTWIGNDWITLVLAVPLLITGMALARRGSGRGILLWLGMLWYGVYNYAFYLFGAALNAFFPLYILPFVLSTIALILAFARLSIEDLAAQFSDRTPTRLVGGYLFFVAVSLTVVWLGMWAAHIFAGQSLPVESEAFRVVAALDISLMVPALGVGGVLLWREHPWGYVVSSVAAVQGALYLLLLTINSAVGILRGLEQAPGQLPVWGPLATATAVAAVLLMANVRTESLPEA